MSFPKKINLIQLIYDVVHYKHFFRDQNNSVIPKKRKKNFHHHFKNFIVTKSSKDASLVKVNYKIRAELFSGSIKETRSNGIKLNSSKLRNSSGSCNFFFIIYFTDLILNNFFFNMELLNPPLFYMNNLKKRKTKRAVKRTSKFSK